MKARGVCITPRELAEDVARSVFEPPGRLVPGILDPACGDGALLAAAWLVGRHRGLRPERIFGLEIDGELAARARQRLRALIPGAGGERAARNVLTTDALADDLVWPAATAVVANPPWVSFSGRQSQASGGRPRAKAAGWPSLHGAFLERIADHVAREGTRAAVLLPAPVLDGEAYGTVRRNVTRRVELAGPPRELGESAFPGVIEPACLLRLQPRSEPGGGSNAAWVESVAGTLVAHLDSFPRLPARCFGDPGVHSGNAARELIVREGRPDLPGIREGRDLVPYRLGAPRIRLNVGLERTAERRFRAAPLERYRSVPILIRQTADRPIAALHTEPTYFRNSLLACTPPVGLAPAFVVAVLNSSVACAWHRARFRDARQRTFPQVKVGHLRSLPMPIRDRSEAPALHDRVVRTVSAGDYERVDELISGAFRA